MLEDMFIGFLVLAFSRSQRKNALSTSRFFFFAPGIRHSDRPTARDCAHLRTFMRENASQVEMGYVICRCPAPQLLEERILALPWECL